MAKKNGQAAENSFLPYEEKKKFIDENKDAELVPFLKKTFKFIPSDFWKLAELDPKKQPDTAKLFQKRVFLNLPEPLQGGYKEAISYIQELSCILIESYVGIPDAFKKDSEPYFREAIERMKLFPHPGFKIRALEIEFRFQKNDWEPSEKHPILENPSEEYLDQMTELVRCMPEKFPWFGECWDFIFEDRLIHLGKKARRCIPAVIEILERYNEEYFNEDVTQNLAPVLYEIGCEDIPPLIHQLHERNEFYMEEFYHKWSKQAPADRWKRFEETLHSDLNSFSKADVWENLLYDSEPGFTLYYENIEKESDRNRIFSSLLEALKRTRADSAKIFVPLLREDQKIRRKKS